MGGTNSNKHKYSDLEERTTRAALLIILLCKQLPKDTINRRLVDQIVRSAGSIGANYREANEAVSKKDFIYRLKISRKETKETRHWLQLIAGANPTYEDQIEKLIQEIDELRSIFSSIIYPLTKKL